MLNRGRIDDCGQCVADVVIDFGSDLHAAKEVGAATCVVEDQCVGEGAGNGDRVEVRGVEPMRIVHAKIDDKTASPDNEAGEDSEQEDGGLKHWNSFGVSQEPAPNSRLGQGNAAFPADSQQYILWAVEEMEGLSIRLGTSD